MFRRKKIISESIYVLQFYTILVIQNYKTIIHRFSVQKSTRFHYVVISDQMIFIRKSHKILCNVFSVTSPRMTFSTLKQLKATYLKNSMSQIRIGNKFSSVIFIYYFYIETTEWVDLLRRVFCTILCAVH